MQLTVVSRCAALFDRLRYAFWLTGCVNVVCCDKTGTLTQNEMTVVDIVTSEDQRITLTSAGHYELDGEVGSLYITLLFISMTSYTNILCQYVQN